jgi:murein DD-endopeptidase MepM/ murein hydrolase activator NlpD
VAGERKQLSPRVVAVLGLAGGIVVIGALLVPIAWAPHATDELGPQPTGSGPEVPSVTGAGEPVADAASDAAFEDTDAAEPEARPVPPVWRVAELAHDDSIAIVEGTVGHHPILAALAAAGVTRGEGRRLLDAFHGVCRLDRLGPKDAFTIAKDKTTGRIVAFELVTSPEDVWQARGRPDGDHELEAKKLELLIERILIKKAIGVGPDLRASVTGAGLDDDLLPMLDDALEGHAELADIRAGARLRIVATEERVQGVFARYETLDAVEYSPAPANQGAADAPANQGAYAPAVRIYWFAPGASHKSHGWYDAKGHQPFYGAWRSPVPLARVASRFNPKRMHPVLHVIMPHNGVDFAAPVGTPVYATAAGEVASAGDGGACGNMVQIHHPNGLTSVYCHLSRFAAGLHAGQHVEQRQLIAYVGQTGRVTGPHLHFGIKRGEVFIDPMTLKLDGVRVIPRSYRDEFGQRKMELDAVLDAIPLAPPRAAETEGQAGETFYEEPP